MNSLVFPFEFQTAASVVSLFSVFVLIGLFFYLNRYTHRAYFEIWAYAWVGYASWLVFDLLGLMGGGPNWVLLLLRQWSIGACAVCLFWGALLFLELPFTRRQMGYFTAFLFAWGFASPLEPYLSTAAQMPLFILIGLSSFFAAVGFQRQQRVRQFVGSGLMFFGFILWGAFLMVYPLVKSNELFAVAGVLISVILQLFMAVSMIVLVLEEVRFNAEQLECEIELVRREKKLVDSEIKSTRQERDTLFEKTRVLAELKQAYQTLEKSQDMLIQQERMNALGQVTDGIAQTINERLAPILALSQTLLKKEKSLDPELRDQLKVIHAAGEQIAQSTHRFRECYRSRQSNRYHDLLNLNDMSQGVIVANRHLWWDQPRSHGINIKLAVDWTTDSCPVTGNEQEISAALKSLLECAIAALPNGGLICWRTRSCSEDKLRPGQAKSVELLVEISGEGVETNETDIRDCAETLRNGRLATDEGSLRMSMVMGAMNRHQGTLHMARSDGQGTIICLRFPATVQAPEQRRIRGADSLKILCVDHDGKRLVELSNMLAKGGFDVETIGHTRGALELIKDAVHEGAAFDVVVSEMGDSDEQTLHFFEMIKTISADTPIVGLTDGDGAKGTAPAFGGVVRTVLKRPISGCELTEVLQRISAGLAVVG